MQILIWNECNLNILFGELTYLCIDILVCRIPIEILCKMHKMLADEKILLQTYDH